MYSFNNLISPQNLNTGIAERIYIALTAWFAPGGIKDPGTLTDPGDEVIIYDDHQFLPGKGFIEVLLAPGQNSYDAKMIGDTGFNQFANEVKILVPGSYALLHEEVSKLIGQPVIVLIKDANCPANMYYQIGSACVPARIAADYTTGDAHKGYDLLITNTAGSVILYNGEITGWGEGISPVARLTITLGIIPAGAPQNQQVSLDASASDTAGAASFNYEVSYTSSVNGAQQVNFIDVGYAQSFLRSLLTNWDYSDITVTLTVTNAYGSDSVTETFIFTGHLLAIEFIVIGTAQQSIQTSGSSAHSMLIRWGDGSSAETFNSNFDDNIVDAIHTYAQPGVYQAYIQFTNIPAIQILYIYELLTDINTITGIDNLALLTNLTSLNIEIGILPYFNPLQALPDSLTYLNLNNNKLTSFVTTIPLPSGLLAIQLSNNMLNTAQVNATLIYLNAIQFYYPVILQLYQTPAAPPSGAGITAKNNLIANGWTVFTD